MNNLDHIKSFYPENYKLDLSETMKAALSKVPGVGGVGAANAVAASIAGMSGVVGGSGGGVVGATASHSDMQQAGGNPGVGYVTEKLYMLLQLYLQNKGWNPSAELLQCFSDLKDNAMLPSAAYLQVLANRLTLDAQGRLILRENGKIVLPFEHFANAVMLKHMSGPHGLHLSVDATVRAVIESYTIGRDQFGMEKEFIVEVVQSCPSPACRYYKNHMGISPLPFMDQQFANVSPAEFLQQHLPHLPPPQTPHPLAAAAAAAGSGVVAGGGGGAGSTGSTGGGNSSASSSVSSVSSGIGPGGEVDLSKSSSKIPPQLQHLSKQQQNSIQSQLSQLSVAAAAAAHHQQQQLQQQQQQQQQQQAQQAQQQQQAQQAQQQQQQQAQQQAAAAAAAAKHQQQLTAALIQQQNRVLAQQSLEKFSSLSALEKQRVLAQLDPKHFDPMAVAAAAANLQMQGIMHSQVAAAANTGGAPLSNAAVPSAAAAAAVINNHHAHTHHPNLPPPSQSPSMVLNSHHNTSSASSTSSVSSNSASSIHSNIETQKNVEALRSNLESLESNKDLLALHNGAWGPGMQDMSRADLMPVGQDKIVRVFAELMRNMARMKTYIRPSMCKPYGKQSESLQKTLMDTIQIVQTLRNCLPAPHIPVTSWKSESEGTNPMNTVLQGNVMPINAGGVGSGIIPLPTNRVEN